jgi:hypothetical protein
MKDKIVDLCILFFQIASAFTGLLLLYMLLALMDSDFGIEGLFVLTFIQPVLGFFLTLTLISVSLVIGLPIRLNRRLQVCWVANNIAVMGIILGFILILISNMYFLQETIEYDGGQKTIPNRCTLSAGWCIIGFMCLHVFPGEKFKMKMKHYLNSIV